MTLIADRDQFIAAAGGCKALMGKSISKALEESIENRESILAAKGDKNFIQVAEEGEPEFIHEAISPIICEGDVIGAVLLLNNDPKLKMGEVEQKLILSAAGFSAGRWSSRKRKLKKNNKAGKSGCRVSGREVICSKYRKTCAAFIFIWKPE